MIKVEKKEHIMVLYSQEGSFFLGPEVKEDAPMKCEPRCEAVNMEDYKGGNLP